SVGAARGRRLLRSGLQAPRWSLRAAGRASGESRSAFSLRVKFSSWRAGAVWGKARAPRFDRGALVLAGSVDGALLALPVGFAEFALENLARGVAGDLVAALHGGRALEVRQALAAEVDDLLLGHVLGQHDEGLRGLAPLLGRDADHRAVGDGRVAHQDVLDLGGVDVLPARDDHVLDPVVHVEVAVLVQVADVAGPEPVVLGQGGLGRLGQVPVPLHVLRGLADDLPDL